MKALIVCFCLMLAGCQAPAPRFVDPAPLHRLDIKWKVNEDNVQLSFDDYNKLGVWLHDVNRYIKDQNVIIEMCKGTK